MYLNTFISLNENTSGYGIKGKRPTGHVSISMPGVIRLYVQGLKELKNRKYVCYAMSRQSDQAIRLGELNSPEKSKQTTWKIDIKKLERNGMPASSIDCVAIVVEGRDIGNTDTVIVGYSREKYLISPLLQRYLSKTKSLEGKQGKDVQPNKIYTSQSNKNQLKMSQKLKEPLKENKLQKEVKIQETKEDLSNKDVIEVIKTEESATDIVLESKEKIQEDILAIASEDSVSSIAIGDQEEDNTLTIELESEEADSTSTIELENEEVDSTSTIELESEEADTTSTIDLESKEGLDRVSENKTIQTHVTSIELEKKSSEEEMRQVRKDQLNKLIDNIQQLQQVEQSKQAQESVSRDTVLENKKQVEKDIQSILINLLSNQKDKEEVSIHNKEDMMETKTAQEVIETEQKNEEAQYIDDLYYKLRGIQEELKEKNKKMIMAKKFRLSKEDIQANNQSMDSMQDNQAKQVEEQALETKVREEEKENEKYFKSPEQQDRFARIRDIFGMSEKIEPFEDDEDISWVRVSHRELTSIPNITYEWATQPFISIAYHEHRHIILGRNNGIEQYYIGIPDKYSLDRNQINKDKIERFKCSKDVNASEGAAGYWIAMI